MSMETIPGDASIATRPWLPSSKAYDFFACSPLIAWYAVCFEQQVPALIHGAAALVSTQAGPLAVLDVLSKLAVFLFAAVLIYMLFTRRPATAKARGLFPRATAFLGAYLGVGILILPHHPINWELKLLSTLLILGGTGFALYGLLWLGRSISIMSEARKLVVGGPYTIVRHPLYVGEEAALVGVVLQFLSPVAILLLALQAAFQLCRMGFEEEVLSEAFPEYAEYKKHTARLIPGIY